MNIIHKANIALALVALLLLVILVFKPEPDSPPTLNGPASESVTQIKIIGKTGLITLIKASDDQQSDYWLVNQQPADIDKIKQLLKLTDTSSHRQFETTPANLELFGLTQPAFGMSFNTWDIQFGTTDPATGRRYVLSDKQIHLITDFYLQYLLVDESFFSQTNF